MDLDFSPEQDVLREMVRSLCVEHCPVEVVRAMEDDARGYPDALFKQLAEVGLLGIVISEAHGGAGQGLLDAAIVYEELGRALAPVPAFESSILCAGVLDDAGSDTQQARWLPQIASGDAIFTPAWLEPQSGFGPRGISLRAEESGGSFRLSGEKRHVTWAGAATRLLVLARTGDDEKDISLFLVDPSDTGLTLTQRKSLAADSQYDVKFDGVAGEMLGDPGRGWEVWERAMERGVILLGAFAMGGAERAHELTTQYAKDRTQFDKPLGAFQAISHYLADSLTQIDGGKVLVYQAAWAHDQGREISRLASMAKLFACDTYRDNTATCQQIWGGVGFTVEYDIQLFFRRAKQLQITWWDAAYLEERIAADALD